MCSPKKDYFYSCLKLLGRLQTAVTVGSASYAQWGLAWSYDRYGNRTAQEVTVGSCSMSSLGYNTKNQITNSGFQYDAAGNLINDGSHTYQYDAESRLILVDGGATASYLYNADGLRVKKDLGASERHYVVDLAGKVLSEVNENSSWMVGYAYLNGQLLAQYSNSTTYFAHRDHLGSTRVLTKVDKTLYSSYDYLPFGEDSGGTGTTHKFTTYERDSESGLDYAIFRYHASTIGRFMTPDPLAGSLANPQSLNRYAYVLNNPINLVDPLGLLPKWVCEYNWEEREEECRLVVDVTAYRQDRFFVEQGLCFFAGICRGDERDFEGDPDPTRAPGGVLTDTPTENAGFDDFARGLFKGRTPLACAGKSLDAALVFGFQPGRIRGVLRLIGGAATTLGGGLEALGGTSVVGTSVAALVSPEPVSKPLAVGGVLLGGALVTLGFNDANTGLSIGRSAAKEILSGKGPSGGGFVLPCGQPIF